MNDKKHNRINIYSLAKSLHDISKERACSLHALSQSIHVYLGQVDGHEGHQLSGRLHQPTTVKLPSCTVHHQVGHLQVDQWT